MNIKAIEQRLYKIENNARENLQLVLEIKDMLNSGVPGTTEFNESDFNVQGLLKNLANSTGVKNVDRKT